LYINQTTIPDKATSVDYNSSGDQGISTSKLVDGKGLAPDYVTKSLTFIKSSITGRLAYVSFALKNVNGRTAPTYYDFYLTPDDFISEFGFNSGKYRVKHDEYDFTNDNANVTELLPYGNVNEPIDEPNIKLNSILDIESYGNFKNCTIFTTRHVLFVNGIIFKTVTQQFFIYTHFYKEYVPQIYIQISKVKEFLIKEEVLIFGEPKARTRTNAELHAEYPDLFTISNIDIYPLLSNCFDNIITTPISMGSIKDELEKRKYYGRLLDATNTTVEVMLLEGLSRFDNDVNISSQVNGVFRIPLLVVNNSVGDVSDGGLFGGSFPNYSIYATGMKMYDDVSESLRFYIKLFSKILLGIMPGLRTSYDSEHVVITKGFNDMTDQELISNLNIPNDMAFETSHYKLFDLLFLESISFNFNKCKFTVHGFNYEAIHGQQQP